MNNINLSDIIYFASNIALTDNTSFNEQLKRALSRKKDKL
jgi:hypothetical protein